MQYEVEVEQETDGRWLAEVPALPGVLAYGQTQEAAIDAVAALMLRVVADRIDRGELHASAQFSLSLRAA
jgi:predicted RNase H-like HicB family nuclease